MIARTTDSAGVAPASREDALAAVVAAELAFPGWSATPPPERSRLLERASELLMERQREIASLVTEETSGTLGWGMFNVQLAADMLAYYAGETEAPAEEQELPSHIPGKRAKAVRQPVGVVVGIAPWNAPVILGVRAVAAPLAYGNTVVLKASEVCPRTHAAIVDALKDAGVPSGAINLVTNDPEDAAEVVDELITHPAVRRISFTGSTKTGRILAEKAARHLKRMVLELGGQNPLIVLADADLEYAVNATAFGTFLHQGQICMSARRIIVERSVAKEFTEKLIAKTKGLKVGSPTEMDTIIGPLINKQALEQVRARVDEAVSHGAKVLTGGKVQGSCYEPTLLTDVPLDVAMSKEETFGPVATITVVDDADEAVTVANQTTYGLSAGILTRDADRGLALAERIEAGIIHINDQPVNDEPQVPFGGVKDSGYGRFGGSEAMHEFTEMRWVTVQGQGGRPFPF